MKGRHPRKLHETPPEFAKAKEAQAAELAWEQRASDYDIRKSEEAAQREKIRNMEMPSHPAPSRRRICPGPWQPVIYESKAAFRRRYEKWAKRFLKKGSHHSST